jgi:hypothetical protein
MSTVSVEEVCRKKHDSLRLQEAVIAPKWLGNQARGEAGRFDF